MNDFFDVVGCTGELDHHMYSNGPVAFAWLPECYA
jgi:hypothetical protein